MACTPTVTTELSTQTTAVTQLVTSTYTSRGPWTTSSCISFGRPWATAAGDDNEDDGDDDDGERGADWNPDGDRGWRYGRWRRRQQRSVLASIRPRQNGGFCAEWAAVANTVTSREVTTLTSFRQVIRSELWTFTPSCSASPTTQPTQNSAPSSSSTRVTANPVAVSGAATSSPREAQPIETAFLQGGPSEVSSSSTMINVASDIQSSGSPTDASLLSAIETASNLGSMGHSEIGTIHTTSTRAGSIEAQLSSAGDKISTEVLLTASHAPTLTGTSPVSSSTVGEGKSGNDVGGIVAGTIGGIAAVLLLVAAWLWWRRKQRDKETTLIFAPDMRSPAPAVNDDYPHSITSVSERPLLVSRFSHGSSLRSLGGSTHLFGRRWTGSWFRPISVFGPASPQTPQVPPVPPRFRNIPIDTGSDEGHVYHYGRAVTLVRQNQNQPLGAPLGSEQPRMLQRAGARVTLTPADDEQISTRTLSLSGLSATSLAYHAREGDDLSRYPTNESDRPGDQSRREGSWDERPIWREVLRDSGINPVTSRNHPSTF